MRSHPANSRAAAVVDNLGRLWAPLLQIAIVLALFSGVYGAVLRADHVSLDHRIEFGKLSLHRLELELGNDARERAQIVTGLASELRAVDASWAQSGGLGLDSPLSEHIANSLAMTAQRYERIDHLRLLSLAGDEVIRFNRRDGDIIRVASGSLQNKYDRDYFPLFAGLEPEQLGRSALSLNMEGGVIEYPHKPVVREGTKLLLGGETYLLVINFVVDLAGLSEATLLGVTPGESDASARGQTDIDLWLVNAAGHFVLGGRNYHDYVFDWQLGDGSRTIDKVLPAVWPALQSPHPEGVSAAGHRYFSVPDTYFSAVGGVAAGVGSGNGSIVLYLPKAYLDSGVIFRGSRALLVTAVALTLLLGMVALVTHNHKLVTRLKRQRDLLNDAHLQARGAYQRLREEEGRRADLLSVVGHEIRSPLAALQMLADDTADRWRGSQAQASRILGNSLKLVDDLKLVAGPTRQANANTSRATLKELVGDSLTSVASSITVNLMQVHTDLNGFSDYAIEGALNRLTGILANIVRNACLHSEGDSIWLRATIHSEHDAAIECGPAHLQVTIEDNGRGIASSEVESVFDMFYRGSTTASGMGIGLHVVREWLEGMGGSVTYFPSSEGGAGFRISCPINIVAIDRTEDPEASKEEDAGRYSEALAAKGVLRGAAVLVVDDDDMLLRLTGSLVARCGGVVTTAKDGVDALAKIDKQSFDLIITDYFMPNLSGVGLIQTLRGRGNTTRIIGVTAATVGEEMEALRAAGADVVLAKPLRETTLIDTVAGFERP